MGEYEDLLANIVESVLAPGQPMTLTHIAEALTERDLSPGHHTSAAAFTDIARVLVVLTARPDRFLKLPQASGFAAATVRRLASPAGVRGIPSPGAAATATPPAHPSSVKALARVPLAAGLLTY